MALRLALSAAVLAMGVLNAAASSQAGRRAGGLGHRTTSFVRALEFKHRLRICNAYPYAAPLVAYRGKSEKLSEEPLPYKSCGEYHAPLKAGDKIEFRVGDANAGTFSVSDLPANDAILLLVIHRHDTLSTAVAFESHVFANLLNAQVAILDTYKGASKSTPKIQDAASSKTKGGRSEDLRYDSVVAVNPGEYEVELVSADGSKQTKSSLVALNRESYVVMRVGVEAQQGQSYPQDLLVYPKSDPAMLHGAAAGLGAQVATLVALVAAFLAW